MHKKEFIDRLTGNLLCIVSFTGHAPMEHVIYHHNPKITCTPSDHVFAPKGEGFYGFLIRAVIGQKTVSWRIEKKRLLSTNKKFFSLNNRFISLNLLSAAYGAGFYIFFGLQGFFTLLLINCLALVFILVIAYLQHYGLSRKQSEDGLFEPYTYRHTWNSRNTFSNFLFFQMPRHSFHHEKPGSVFKSSVDRNNLPTLPFGYVTFLPIVLCPPLFKYIMDPRVDEIINHD